MYKSGLLTFFIFCFLCISASGQSIRAAYAYYHKTEIESEYYKTESEMMLDWTPEKSVYYNDATFHRDSLMVIALDKAGEICNQEAYNQMFDYRGSATKNVYFLNHAKGEYDVLYRLATCILTGKGKMSLPQWNITEESKVIESGLKIRKAFADYLGRKWIVWYCEDIPIPAGPWLLWGTPGLIAEARDSEGIFYFKLLNVETEGIVSRLESYKDIYNEETTALYKIYVYDIKKVEQLHNQMSRDLDFNFKMCGLGDSPTIIVDAEGNESIANTKFPYIPLIPDEYWK